MRRLLILLVVLGGMYALAEFGTKVYAETRLRREVQASLPAESRVEVGISFPLLVDLLTESNVERIQVTVNNLDVGPFSAAEVKVELHRVELDRDASLREWIPVIDRIDILDTSVEIEQSELSRILPSGFSFQLEQDRVILQTPAGRLAGRFEKTDAGRFRFISEETLPLGLRPGWEFGEVALVDCFDRITIVPGRVLVACTLDDPQPDLLVPQTSQ